MSNGCKCNCETFLEHARGVSFSSAAMPTRRPQAARINAKEEQWSKDGDAYRRLRQQGLQPADVDGAAALESKAVDTMEIERGKLYGKDGVRARKQVADQLSEVTG